MGGDSFEGLQKLTNQQYVQMTAELLQILKPYCQKVQPYIPLPEKQVHGDIDFLIILKEQFKVQDIIDVMKMEKYRLNNNDTINSVYKNKQVDYLFVKTGKQFELASFYKSYSGIGAYLGVFLPSKQIKISTKGLVALGFHKHLKLEFVVSDSPKQILQFYGLNFQEYKNGFKTRKQLFEFLRKVRFLDQEKFVHKEQKHPSKLIKFMINYMNNQGLNYKKEITVYEKPQLQTLSYFKKTANFHEQFQKLIKQKENMQNLNKKFNAIHIMQHFGVKPQQVKQLRKKFNSEFENEQKYYQFIEKNEIDAILEQFGAKCGLEKAKTEQKQ